MKLNQLEYFVVLAEEHHFGKAAARVHRSQPPFSRQIRLLEESLGTDLFVRHAQGTELTQAGELFLKNVRPALAQLHQAAESVRQLGAGARGILSIGMPGSMMLGIVPYVLANFRLRFPDAVIDLRQMPKSEQIAALKARRLNVGFTRSLSFDTELRFDTLLTEPLMVALASSHRLSGKASIQIEALIDEDFILYRGHAAPSVADQIVNACHEAGFSPRVVQESEDMQSAAALSALGVGITLVAASLQPLRLANIVYVPVFTKDVPLTTSLFMVYRNDDVSALVPALLATAHQTCALRDWSGALSVMP